MPSYSLTKLLPSCGVSKKTIEELEDYMVKTLTGHKTDPGSRILTRLTIKDSSGKEIVDSVKDIDRNAFPNDIRGIEMQADDTNFPALSIGLQFSVFKRSNELTVSYRGNASREVVRGIADEIMHRIERYRTNHYLFHNGVVAFIVFGLAIVGAWPMFSWRTLEPENKNIYLNVFIFTLFAAVFYFSMSSLKPYTSFDTRRNEIREQRANWVLYTLLGFFLVTVLGVYFRQRLLGF